MANFKEACTAFKLPLVLGQEQISAFLEHLQDKNYVLATLQKNWATIKILADELKVEITHEMKIHYNYVMDHCKQITEGRLPVTTLLLTQLITAADQVLSGYNALLAKSMFICAFAFSMRVGEYTCNPGKKRGTFYREHNILANSIKIATGPTDNYVPVRQNLSAWPDPSNTEIWNGTSCHRGVRISWNSTCKSARMQNTSFAGRMGGL